MAEVQDRVRECHVMGDAKPSTGLHQKLLTAADHHTKAHLELEKAQMYLQYMRLDNFTQGRGVAHALVAILMASMPEKLMHLCTDAYRLEVDRKDEEFRRCIMKLPGGSWLTLFAVNQKCADVLGYKNGIDLNHRRATGAEQKQTDRHTRAHNTSTSDRHMRAHNTSTLVSVVCKKQARKVPPKT